MTKIKSGEIIRGDDQTISVPVPSVFASTIGAYAALFVVPTNSATPDVYIDPAALIAVQLGPFDVEQTSFDFSLTSAPGLTSSAIPLGTYDWYVRYKSASNKITSILLKPRTVEVIPLKGMTANASIRFRS